MVLIHSEPMGHSYYMKGDKQTLYAFQCHAVVRGQYILGNIVALRIEYEYMEGPRFNCQFMGHEGD